MSDQAFLALVGLFGTITAGLFKLINDQNKLHGKIAEGLTGLTKASERGAKATERAAREAAERNGHLAEISVQQGDRIIQHMKEVQEQHVKLQAVDEQVVEHETVKKRGK